MSERVGARVLGSRPFIRAGVLLTMLALSFDALTPRPDWYDAPFRLWPPHFRLVYGRLGSDKIEHIAAAFGLTLGLAVALDGSRPGSRAVWHASVAIQLWCTAIEIIQGFLPYRDCELLDVVANVMGGLLGLGALYALRVFAAEKMPRGTLDSGARLSKTARHV